MNPDDLPAEEPPRPKKFPCPSPEYARDMNDLRVGKKWRHIERGRRLRERRPYLYNVVLGWCDVEAEAEVVRNAYDERQRKNKSSHEEASRQK